MQIFQILICELNHGTKVNISNMQTHAPSKIWFYLTILPNFVILTGLILVYSANTFKWGLENQIPVSMLLGLFFAEFSMVISGLGIVGFIKTKPKTKNIKYLGLWNVLLMTAACVTDYNIFMTL